MRLETETEPSTSSILPLKTHRSSHKQRYCYCCCSCCCCCCSCCCSPAPPPCGTCGVWWLQLPLLLFPALLLLLVMLLQTLYLVLLRMMSAMLLHCVFQSYFDVALSVVFNAVSVQFHADLTVVPNAFHLYAYICFPMVFQCFLITRSHSR